MQTFRKYEFTPTEWATLRKLIEKTTIMEYSTTISWVDCAVVELGFLPITPAVIGDDFKVTTPAVLSEKWAVDILFYAEVPAEFTPFEVWPDPMGIHTFSGDDNLYLSGYCAKFPESDYCKLPEPVITNEAL